MRLIRFYKISKPSLRLENKLKPFQPTQKELKLLNTMLGDYFFSTDYMYVIYNVWNCAFEDVPLYINAVNKKIRTVANWRLKIGK